MSSSELVNICSSSEKSNAPIRAPAKRRRIVVLESSQDSQRRRGEVAPTATSKKRGKDQGPMTLVVTSGTKEADAMEIEESELYDDLATAQL